jgi:hypothetical protein
MCSQRWAGVNVRGPEAPRVMGNMYLDDEDDYEEEEDTPLPPPPPRKGKKMLINPSMSSMEEELEATFQWRNGQ